MQLLVIAVVLGFSLDRDAVESAGRRLAERGEPCSASCDSGRDRDCDEQDSTGDWTLSCDTHPTTSCDADCYYPPPPPLYPWMGDTGTHPSPPPPPLPPADAPILVVAWLYFLVAVLLLLSFSCYHVYYYCSRFWSDAYGDWDYNGKVSPVGNPSVPFPSLYI